LGFSFLNSSLVLKWQGECAVLRVKDCCLGPLSYSGKIRYFILMVYISYYWLCKGILFFFEKEARIFIVNTIDITKIQIN
jgi:hypothetical protein